MKRQFFLVILGMLLIFITACSTEEPQTDQEALTETDEAAEVDKAENERSRAHDIIDEILKNYDGNKEKETDDTEASNASDESRDENENDTSASENDHTEEEETSAASNERPDTSNDTNGGASGDEASSSGNSTNTSDSNGESEQSNNTGNETKDEPEKETDKNSNEKPEEAPEEEPKALEKTVTVSIETGDVKGTILSETEVAWEAGDTALDVTQRIAREKGIQISVRGSGSGAYVEGINNLYEFDEGPLSGWHLLVDGAMIDRSAGAYSVSEGQSIAWRYTVDFMEDSQ